MGSWFDLVHISQHFMQALAAILALAPRVAPPGQITESNATYLAQCLVAAEQAYRIPWSRVAGVIQHESQWRETVVSRTHDYGLGQHHCPSFFCPRHPAGNVRALLLEPCTNIHLTALELWHKRALCKRRKQCKSYIGLYNSGNPRYAASIARWEEKFRAAGRDHPRVSRAKAGKGPSERPSTLSAW